LTNSLWVVISKFEWRIIFHIFTDQKGLCLNYLQRYNLLFKSPKNTGNIWKYKKVINFAASEQDSDYPGRIPRGARLKWHYSGVRHHRPCSILKSPSGGFNFSKKKRLSYNLTTLQPYKVRFHIGERDITYNIIYILYYK